MIGQLLRKAIPVRLRSCALLTIALCSNAIGQSDYADQMSRQFDSLYAYRLLWPSLTSENITVHYSHIDTTYVEAILRIISKAMRVYEDSLSASFAPNIIASIGREEGKRQSLFQNSYDRIVWEYGIDSVLAAPTRGGKHHVYGICHELGHMVLGVGDYELNEAWANHLASFIAIPALYAQAGDSLWPDPYNYLKSEGPERSIQFVQRHKSRLDLAIKLLYDVYSRSGVKLFRRIISALQPTYRQYGTISSGAFALEIARAIGDSSILSTFHQFRFTDRGPLYTPCEQDSVVPTVLASGNDSILARVASSARIAPITGRCVIYFLPDSLQFDSLSSLSNSGFDLLLKDQFYLQRDLTGLLQKSDIPSHLSNSSDIVVQMNTGELFVYPYKYFKHATGCILTDGVHTPVVISGAMIAEDIVDDLRKFFHIE